MDLAEKMSIMKRPFPMLVSVVSIIGCYLFVVGPMLVMLLKSFAYPLFYQQLPVILT